jgi:beta-aspartyl-peptidase (threonine type)
MSELSPPAIIIHGGAGDAPPTASVPESSQGLRAAALAAWSILVQGGSSLDAVETAVRLLEDDPEFNAGTGSCLTAAGDVELDASIMDGATLRCGAVAAVRDVRNPISLARLVMERTEHVLLVGPGASAFARSAGVPAHPNHLLITPRQRARWEERQARTAEPVHLGTVGAVARDRHGHLAAATSTGGTAMKLPGRVGDSALIGAGTYADDLLGAVSCTGQGERMIQLALARQAVELTHRLGAQKAARAAVALLGQRVAGRGGLITLGPRGDPGFALNTASMARAYSRGGELVVEWGP